MKMRILTVAVAILSVFAMAGMLHAAPVITVDPPIPPQIEGDTFTLKVVGTGFSETTIGGGLQFIWDPNILTLASKNDITFTFPDSFFTFAEVDTAAGSAVITVSGFLSGASGSFGIVDILFTASGVGNSAFDIEQRPGDAFIWKDLAGTSALNPQPLYEDGAVQVNAIPIPSTLVLLGGGLMGLVALRRRRS